MATTTRPANLDVGNALSRATDQFRGLNSREPGQWPLLPKICAWLAATIAVVTAGWFLFVQTSNDELEAARAEVRQDLVQP